MSGVISLRFTTLLCLTMLVAACGGGGGGGGGGGAAPTEPLNLSEQYNALLRFPPPGTYIPEQEEFLFSAALLRADAPFDFDDISLITLNSEYMNSSALDDTLVTKTLTTPYPSLDLALRVVFSDDSESVAELSIPNSSILFTQSNLAVDDINNVLYVYSSRGKTIHRVDLTDYSSRRITAPDVGSGEAMNTITNGLVIDAARDKLWVPDYASTRTLISVDLDTQVRAALHGTGPDIGSPSDLAISPEGDFVLVPGLSDDALYLVDLGSGDREVIANDETGSGDSIDSPVSVTLSATPGQAYVLGHAKIYAVTLNSGDRTLVSGGGIGFGPTIEHGDQIRLHASTGHVILADEGRLMSINMASGQRTLLLDQTDAIYVSNIAISNATNRVFFSDRNSYSLYQYDLTTDEVSLLRQGGVGDGQRFFYPQLMALNTDTDTLYFGDTAEYTLRAVNTQTSAKSVIAKAGMGTGPSVEGPSDTLFIEGFEDLIYLDQDRDAILSVDVDTGNRAVLFENSSGPGADLLNPVAIAATSNPVQVYVADASAKSIVLVDLVTGHSHIVSSAATGSGTAFNDIRDLVYSPDTNRIYVAQRDGDYKQSIVEVHPLTGDRVVISDDSHGTGTTYGFPVAIELGLKPGTLLATYFLNGVVEIALSTGNRTIISNNETGIGAPFSPELTSIAVDHEKHLIYVGDMQNFCILAILPETGDRVILAQ